MQLKSIGRISEAGNLLDSLLGDFNDIDKVSAAIENLTLTESAELLVKKGLGDDEAKLALVRKVGSEAAAKQALESAKVTAAETAETGATVGLSTAFKGLAASMKAFATSVPGILAIITAVGYGAYKLFDLLTVSYEEHLEKLEEAKQAYTDAESEVESLQGQLDELNSKIEEINNQDTLSLSDEQDLKNLVAETKELQRQLNIAKERAKFEGRKAEREAIDTLNSKQVSNYKKGMSETGEETVSLTTSREELKEAINAYDRIKDAVDDYQAQMDILESSGIFEGDQYDKINKNLEYHKQLLDETGLNITNLADELRGQSDSLIGATEEGNKLKLSVEESLQAYDEWHNRINNVSEAFDALSESEQKQVLINKLADKGYDYEKIAKIVSNLSSDAFKTISDNFSDFEKQIDEVSEKSSDINVLSNSISRFITEASKLKDGNQIDISNVDSRIIQNYVDELKEARKVGVDLNKTIYGNIDTDNRQILRWTSQTLEQYKDILQSWDDEAINNWDAFKKDMEGSISTIFGSSSEFDGVEIAFSPMLQTENGAVLLDKNTVDEYIFGLIDKAKKDDGNWDANELFRLDAKGLEFDGRLIKNLLADIGDTAIQTGEAMHFVGKQGSIMLTLENVIPRLKLSESLGNIESYKKSIESTTTAISALTTAVSEQYTQNYITQESYDALIDANKQFAECIEFGNGYMRLNVQQANELTKANAELKLSELDLKEALEVEQYNKNIEALKQLGDSDDELRAKLEAENSKIEENVRQYDLLEAQLLGVTSAYNDWIASQSAPDVGDQYDKMVSDYKKVEELYQKGLTGDAEFQAFNKLIGGEDAVTADFEKNLETFKRYFSETEVGINNFIDDIVRVNNLELNADGLYDGVVDWQKTMQELGLTHDEMQSLFDKLEQYEFHIDTTSGIDGLDDLKEHQSELNAEIENYRENIEKAKAQGIDTTDAENSLKSLQERYASITDEIVKMKDEASDGKITLDVDAELAKLDLSNISQEAQETLNKLKADNEQLKLSVQIGVDDTSYLEGKVKADLALLKEQLKVPVETDSDTANKSIKELTQTATDFDKVINQAKTNTQNLGTIRVGDLGFNSLNSSVGNVNTSVSTLQRNLDTIASKTYTLKVTTSQEGKGKLLGTTGGFAFANGSGIAAQESSLSLTGELGRELIVRGNRWFTVGDNGAEFAHIKKGDIVFDAYQTSQLLDGSGKINSRGTALANGTAYVGKNRKESSKTETSVKGLGHVKTGTSTTKDNGGKNNKDSTDKTTKKTKQLVDWIERRINVLTTKAERWSNIIEKATNPDRVDSYYKKLDSITQKQVKTYGDAYNRYMSKANTVKLSQGLKNKVQSKDSALFDKNGNLKSQKELIKKYGEKTYNRIQDYQNWYDKAISAIDEFTESSYKLANSPLEKAADKIDLLSKSMDVLDSKLKTYTVNDYASANKTIDAQMTNFAQQNDANRQALITAASKVNAVKNTSYEDLIKNGKKLEEIDVSSLKLGSKKYKNAVKQNAYIKAYNEALEVAQKSENELIKQNIEYRKQQFDNVQNYYDKQLELKQAEYDIEEGEIKLLEARGAFVQASHYKAESDIERDKLKILNDENAALTQQLKLLESTENGKYSEEWYECSKAIRDVNEAINDAKVNLANLNDKMNTTVKTLMNYTIGVGERATNEINFVIDLMGEVENFDMNHIVTNEGITRLGSYVANMRIASEEAGTLHDAVLAIQTAIEKGESKVNLGIFGNLDYSEEVDSAKRMTETYEEFLDKWQDKIKETYDYRVKMHEFVKNMLQEEMSALNELISDYKDALNDTKNLKDYQKNVREQTDNIGSLRKQMSGVSGDTSEEGINRYLQLQKELSDAEKQLEETELDHMLNEQQAMLDKLSEEYQSTITALSADTNYLDEVANGILSSNNKLLDDIYNEYVKDYRYAEQFKNAMTVALNSEDGILTDIKDALTGNESPIIKAITDSSTNIVNAVNNDNANNSNNQSTPTPTPDVDSGSSNTSSASTGDEVVGQVQLLRPLDEWDMMKADVEAVFADSKYYAKGKKKKASDYKTPINQFLFSKNGKVLSDDGLKQLRKILKTDNNNILNVLKDLSQMKGNIKNVGGFAKGGIGKLVKPTGEDGLTWVRNEEGFVAPEDVKHIQDLLTITPQITKAFETSTLPTPLANNSIGDIEFNIEMNGVNDVETFSQQIREAYCSDARIRKMIQADNIGQISGNATKTTRNRYR